MSARRTDPEKGLKLTREESESLGLAFPEAPKGASLETRERPLHEQIGCLMNEDDVTEALLGEVTLESREATEDLFADMQEEEADRQAE